MAHMEADEKNIVFIDADAGTGKTFVEKTILNYFRGNGKLAIAVSSSGISALNLPGGETSFSKFKIPLNPNENTVCNIRKQSKMADLIRQCSLVI